MRIEDVTDLDWYIDNVVVPSGPDRRPVGPVRAWQASWQSLAHRVAVEADASSVGNAARLALSQGFILSRGDVRRCGVSDAQFRRLVRRRSWRPIDHGCVTVDDTTPGNEHLAARRAHTLWSAAALRKRREHVISSASAAILHGLPTIRVPVVPVLAAESATTYGRRGRAEVQRLQLARDEIELWFGVSVARIPRAVADLARTDPRSGLMAADAALHEGLISAADLDVVLQSCAGLPGIRRARQVLALADALIESPLESLTHLALHDCGLPAPKLQRWIRAADGKRYRVDFLWPELRLILEADGRAKNSEAERWREKRRDVALERAGYRVVRLTWQDVLYAWPAAERWLRELMFASRT